MPASCSAAYVLPDAVGPQSTGTTGTSLTPKTSLELWPGELHNGGPSVHVVRGELRIAQRQEERTHLSLRELVASLDGRLAGDGGREPLVTCVRAGVTIASEGRQRVPQASFRVEARVRERHAVHEQRVPAESLHLESECGEHGAIGLERVTL